VPCVFKHSHKPVSVPIFSKYLRKPYGLTSLLNCKPHDEHEKTHSSSQHTDPSLHDLQRGATLAPLQQSTRLL